MSSASLQLEPRLDLRAAGSLAKTLLELQGKDLELDAGGVKQIGALAVQAIRAAACSWAASGNTLRFANASNDLNDQLVLLGHTPETLTQWEQPQ